MTKIILNNKEYNIDESILTLAKSELQSHLSTTMAGSGATITLDGTTYSVDSTKLSTATNTLLSHLGTIAGEGAKIKVGNVEYSVDSTKLSGAMSELGTAFGELENSGSGEPVLAAGLYDADGNMLASWDELLADGTITVQNGTITSAKKSISGNLVVHDFVTSIGVNVFYACSSLTSVNMLEGVTSIGNYAFMSCYSLVSIEIPDSVTSIGDRTFYGCSLLTDVTFDGTIEQWNAITKGDYWNSGVPATHVHCSNGDVVL